MTNVVELQESGLNESSGLAASRRHKNRFWTHNDSGDGARLFAFNRQGRKTGQIRLKSATSLDWEDMASFVEDGVPRLLVADCGDNRSRRKSITLFLFDEPDPDKSTSVVSYQTIQVSYADGPRNCESVAVDEIRREIILVAKSRLPLASVYVIPLPNRESGQAPTKVIARKVGNVIIPMATAIDLDQETGDIWLANYFQAFRFPSKERDATISSRLLGPPEPHPLPRWKQIEAIAVDSSGRIWLTSEGSPAPLGCLVTETDGTPATK